jgi:hypothetical protein
MIRLVRVRVVVAAVAVATVLGACDGAVGVVSSGEPADRAAGASPAPATASSQDPTELTPVLGPAVDPYRGLGTWIDLYDHKAWDHPERSVRVMRDRGVRTLYLQTSSSSRGRPFVHPDAVDRFLDAAAGRGILVVGWYVPGLADLSTDLRRSLRAIERTTSRGNRFAGFALDIEPAAVRDPERRTRHLLELTERLRRIAGPHYPLGAIVPSSRRLRTDPRYWPGFPYRPLAGMVDAFLPLLAVYHEAPSRPLARRVK